MAHLSGCLQTGKGKTNPVTGGFVVYGSMAYRTVSYEVANLLAVIPPIEFIVKERLNLYLKKKELSPSFRKKIKRMLAELYKKTIAQ